MLLLPLRDHPNASPQPWELIGAEGYGITTRVAAEMGEPELPTHDSRAFIIREFVNSFRRGDPMALFTAASLLPRQAAYFEPELTANLEKSIGADQARWTKLLAAILITQPEAPQSPPLAEVARRHLPAAAIETLLWQSLLADLAGFSDQPSHPLFSYNPSPAAQAAKAYLLRYRNDAAFLAALKTALREDQTGSSYLAWRLIDSGPTACLPEALDRAMLVVRRPDADGDDVFSSIRLILTYGAPAQRGQLAALAQELKAVNPDYAAFLQRQLGQTR